MQRPLRAPLRCRPIRPTPSRSAIRLRGETRREGWPEPLICTHLRSSDQRRSAPISGSFRSLRLCVPCVLSRQNGIGHERAQRTQRPLSPSRSAIRLRGESRREGLPKPLICTHPRSSNQHRSAPISGLSRPSPLRSLRSLAAGLKTIWPRKSTKSAKPEARSQKSEVRVLPSAFRLPPSGLPSNPVKPSQTRFCQTNPFRFWIAGFGLPNWPPASCHLQSSIRPQLSAISALRTTDHRLLASAPQHSTSNTQPR